MATRKRTSRRGGLVGRAVRAGRTALRQAESHVPADLRRQLDRRLRDAEKTARAAIKALQTQVKRASTRADVNSVLKRIDGLTKTARQVARGTTSRTSSTRRRTTSTARRAATRTKKAAGTARRKATTTRRATTRRTSSRRSAASTSKEPTTTTTRRAAPRRRAPSRRTPAPAEMPLSGMPEVHTVPMGPETGTGGMGPVTES